jgi:hypothetical protein
LLAVLMYGAVLPDVGMLSRVLTAGDATVFAYDCKLSVQSVIAQHRFTLALVGKATNDEQRALISKAAIPIVSGQDIISYIATGQSAAASVFAKHDALIAKLEHRD